MQNKFSIGTDALKSKIPVVPYPETRYYDSYGLKYDFFSRKLGFNVFKLLAELALWGDLEVTVVEIK